MANVFLTDKILKIDIQSGTLIEEFDMKDLIKDLESSPGYNRYVTGNANYCLNGIAYNENDDKLIVTGKKWPFLYEIKFIDNN